MVEVSRETVCSRCGERIVWTKWGSWMHRPRTNKQRPLYFKHKPKPQGESS